MRTAFCCGPSVADGRHGDGPEHSGCGALALPSPRQDAMQRLPAPLGASPAGTSENTMERCLFPPAADKRMNDADLNSFNNGLQAIVNAFDERCAAMNVRRPRQPWHAPLSMGCPLL